MSKRKIQGRPAPAAIRAANVSYEYRPDGSIYWTHIPDPIEDVKSGRAAWRLIWCAGYDLDDKGQRHYHHLECIPCHCNPGPQMQALWATAREVALYGGRGSAKSEVTFPFLAMGNRTYDAQHMKPADHTYLNCPDYTFLVLRKNAKDLRNYFERASRFFKLFGGEPTFDPMGVRFPSGAFGVFDHMADGEAWEKYQGPEWTRMVVEEAPQLPNESSYLRLIAACRTSNPDMQAQIMLTANPGGVGWPWFKARFINPEGKRLPSNTVYTEPFSGRTRIAIFSTVDDNPYQMAKGYDKDLDSYKISDPALYKQWRLGDVDAVAGQYFEHFRVKRIEGEPENALHVIPPQKLDKYWPRAIGCDWGYSHASAVKWGCWHPKKQLHVYREFVASRMGAVELGAEIARRSLPELQQMPVPHMTLYLSHDAFARENDRATEAEQIKQGVDRILGDGAAFLLAPDESEELLEDGIAWRSVLRRQQERAAKTHITIVNAGMKRRGNLNLIRQYMRWWPVESESMEFNEATARRILMGEGALAYWEYKQKCEKRDTEVLPVLQIHDCCPYLIAALQAAVEAENDPEQMQKQDGDDPVDALAYLVGNFAFQEADIPREVQIANSLAAMKDERPGLSTNSLVMAARTQEWKRDRVHHSYSLPRRASARHHAMVH